VPSDQMVEIVDNRLVLNSEPLRKYPVLRPDKSIMLYVNGQPKKGPVIVSNEEEISFKIADEQQGELFDFEVSEDKLRVFLMINRRQKKRLYPVIIKDTERLKTVQGADPEDRPAQ